jgi:ATP-dependent RNA helicase RhlE
MQIMVASDASARSLDVTGASHVINFDVPQTPEDYVHRLGRAGRAEAVGDVFTLMSPEETEGMAAVERLVGRAVPRVMLPDFDYAMHPGDLKRVVSFGEQHGPAGAFGSEGGVATAAVRITTLAARGGSNGKSGHRHHNGAKTGGHISAKLAQANSHGGVRGPARPGEAAKPRPAIAARASAVPGNSRGSAPSANSRASALARRPKPKASAKPKSRVAAKASAARARRPARGAARSAAARRR